MTKLDFIEKFFGEAWGPVHDIVDASLDALIKAAQERQRQTDAAACRSKACFPGHAICLKTPLAGME